jgi:hypothetical protein
MSERLQALIHKLRSEHPEHTPEERDRAHDIWRNTSEGLVAIIRDPRLGVPPSERSWELSRAILLDEIASRMIQK